MGSQPTPPQANHNKLSGKARFFYGLFGSGLVEAIRALRIMGALAASSNSEQSHSVPNLNYHDPVIIVIVLFLIIGGGVFAMSWREDHGWKCMYLGATVTLYMSAWAHFL